jgi:hypothetical protein
MFVLEKEIRFEIARIGCCISYLIQGVYKYYDVEDNKT